MKRFEFATASRIIFGEGTLSEAGSLAAEMGKLAFVVTGVSGDLSKPLNILLNECGVKYVFFPIRKEPTVRLVCEGVAMARDEDCDLVIGFGGGSAIDTGKAVSALITNDGDIFNYLEVIGDGHPLTQPPLPFIAIPTTAGTGAEATRNAVIGSPEEEVKVSLRSAGMLPRLAFVDPELTYSLSPQMTASTGMDALTQVLEPYVSKMANPFTDAVCRDGMRLAASALKRVFHDGQDREARRNMSLASLYGGLWLANAKLGAVHGFAGPLGGMYNAPHGAVCACLLPPVMTTNVKAIKSRGLENELLKRYDEVGKFLTGDKNATADDDVAWIQELEKALEIPSLADLGVNRNEFDIIIDKAARASSMKGNPIELTKSELHDILEMAL